MAADGHRHVLAIGGLSDSAGLDSRGTPLLLSYAATLAGARTPKICIINTASGDDSGAYSRSYQLLGAIGGRLTHLQLFPMPNVADPEDLLLSQDMVLVGGGSVANMLAVWRVHGIDSIMRRAWQAGVVLSGISAGAICWFTSGTTDSFGADLRPFTGGLGLLEASYCPHYDSEPRRRPLYQSLIADRSLPPGIACDDGAAAHFVDSALAGIVADTPGPRGYSVERTTENTAVETVLDSKVLNGRCHPVTDLAGCYRRPGAEHPRTIGTYTKQPEIYRVLTVHNFSYGLVTPALAYLMSFVGAFLGLRCTSRARASTGATRIRWLLVAALSIGTTGIWVMHFIAMLGFTIPGETIRYNVTVTLLSMLIAVAFVLIGVLIVGLSHGTTTRSLLLAGVITGLGVAAMHYSGMAAMRMPTRMSYNPGLFALSIAIAIVAATAALWATLRLVGFWSTFGAAAIMGVAVSGMHYTGMAAMRVYPPDGSSMAMGGADAAAFLLPLVIGVSVTTFVLTATIALSPTADEISAEAELMRQIDSVKAQPTIVSAPAPPPTNHNRNFRKLTLRQ